MPRAGGRGSGAGRSTHAKPPHDNPLLRQQDRMLARCGIEEDTTASLRANRNMTTAAALSAFKAPRARGGRRTARAALHAATLDGAERRLDALRTTRGMPHANAGGMAV